MYEVNVPRLVLMVMISPHFSAWYYRKRSRRDIPRATHWAGTARLVVVAIGDFSSNVPQRIMCLNQCLVFIFWVPLVVLLPGLLIPWSCHTQFQTHHVMVLRARYRISWKCHRYLCIHTIPSSQPQHPYVTLQLKSSFNRPYRRQWLPHTHWIT